MQVLLKSDKLYPELLGEIYQAPAQLYVAGNLPNLPMIAIVGSRKPTPYGEMVAYKISADLARAGFCIVSGLAYGIDSIVHRAALESNGKTVAVLGSGLENIYPTKHRPLAREIIRSSGAIISEYPASTPPLKHHFPARNRIIAGLAQATIVPEADAKSGSLITAQLALDENRLVFAVPGPITSARSSGPNNLLKAGASVITSAADVCAILGSNNPEKEQAILSTKKLSQNAQIILQSLQNNPATTDDLSTSTKLAIPELLSTLTLLEMQNFIRSTHGNTWISTITI